MKEVLAGAALGLSLAAPPGPVMAVMATAASRGRSRESILTALGAISADAVWLSLVTLGFIAFLGNHPRAVGGLGLGGACLLLWMAYGAYRSARVGLGESKLRGSYRLGLLTVLTSPFSFAWWMANGALLLATLGWGGIAGMFSSLVLYSFVITYAFGWMGVRFRHTANAIAYISVVMLAGFGFYVAHRSVQLLAS
ncbi:MAG: LysE family translocator [Acidobacteria bacterium]|nr:LysE family translocator [Acidobacteriota bacterium]